VFCTIISHRGVPEYLLSPTAAKEKYFRKTLFFLFFFTQVEFAGVTGCFTGCFGLIADSWGFSFSKLKVPISHVSQIKSYMELSHLYLQEKKIHLILL